MRRLNKIALLLLVCTMFTAIFTLSGSAKTYTGTKYGYHSDYIYVHTTSTNAKISLNFSKGTLNTSEQYYDFFGENSGNKSYQRYASYELKISYWNGSKYVMESNYDVYNKSSNTITLKRKNTDYRIQVYQWKVKTTYDSYKRNGLVYTSAVGAGTAFKDDDPFWKNLPKYSTGTLKNCTMYSKNPH